MKLYTIPDCPFCFRVKIALKMRKIVDPQIEIIEIDLKNPPENFLAISPNKTVPALELSKGIGFAESMLIIEYLDSIPGKGDKLFGNNLVENMHAKYSVEQVSEKVTKPIMQTLFCNGSVLKERRALSQIPLAFYELEKLLDLNNSRFLGGQEINAADINLIPFFLYYFSVENIRKKWTLPEPNSRVAKYLNDIIHHSLVRKSVPSIEEFTKFVTPLFSPSADIHKIKNSSRTLVDDISAEIINLNDKISTALKNKITQIWHNNSNKSGPYIETVFQFKNYEEAFNAIQIICDLQESADHHSNFILENFNQLKVELCTHEPKWGVTSMDFAFAEVLTTRIYN
ncbi:glutathione S-transferase N-terminal domain-containing protein [Fluviispira vulneris]|uniref:glutathione S-transferase N-terminal domain-containing protein n=1 Tax=Fluviispira vulneris TaxID=2763012 RepID=UPI001647FA5F|nr:glutathione S-transferase N-terminal domain-containing protein [Fluviispira vulneris]